MADSKNPLWFRIAASLAAALILFACGILPQSYAQSSGRGIDVGAVTPVTSEQRLALVIGNAQYKTISPLRNPINDARAMAQALKDSGFRVSLLENASRRDMLRAINEFGRNLVRGGVGLFYYAGHGVQSNGNNYLIPLGASIERQIDLEYEAVNVGRILAEMGEAKNRLNLVILDACRNNPYASEFRSANAGLAQISAPTGSLLAYATAPGKAAADGDGANGLYTGKLIRHIRTPGLKLEEVFKQVRRDVLEESGGLQIPWESTSVTGDFYFREPVSRSRDTPEFPLSSSEQVAGQLIIRSTPPGAEIVLDGSPLNKLTDTFVSSIPVGNHSITLRKGNLEGTGIVNVQAGKRSEFELVLTAPSSSVEILTTPRDSQVFIDGKEIGRSPLTFEATPGRHSLLIRSNDHYPVREELVLGEGLPSKVSVNMAPKDLAYRNWENEHSLWETKRTAALIGAVALGIFAWTQAEESYEVSDAGKDSITVQDYERNKKKAESLKSNSDTATMLAGGGVFYFLWSRNQEPTEPTTDATRIELSITAEKSAAVSMVIGW